MEYQMYKKTFFLAGSLSAILAALIIVNEYNKSEDNESMCEENSEVIINKIILEQPTLKEGGLKYNEYSIAPYYYEIYE